MFVTVSQKLKALGGIRFGCIGCQFGGSSQMKQDFERYPKFKKLYLIAFDEMLKAMPDKSERSWKTAEDVMNWWLSDKVEKPIEGQICFEELIGEEKSK